MILEARSIRNGILSQIEAEIKISKRPPKLVVILVWENPASLTYINGKRKACEEIGMSFELVQFEESVSETTLLAKIDEINRTESIDGLIIQLPLPKHIDAWHVIDAINPVKDVDGFTKENIGKLFLGRNDWLISCTPKGILRLLEHYEIPVKWKHAVIIGRSNIVGKPLSLLLQNAGATVTLCHSLTPDLSVHTRDADIVIVAVGRAMLVTADMIREGATIIDVGVNRLENGKICGDADFDEIIKKANCSPVPGGVGPMTISMLLENTWNSYKKKHN